jgi:hypothetical protein
VFVIADNGSDHRGRAAVRRLHDAWPNAIVIRRPAHASWLIQAGIFFSITQRKGSHRVGQRRPCAPPPAQRTAVRAALTPDEFTVPPTSYFDLKNSGG